MNSTQVQKALNLEFRNYLYQINNQFIFNWESDFFCMSERGYCVEVEIKVSQGDYRKDFEKEKHKYFEAIKSGKNHYVEYIGSGKGNKICSFKSGRLVQPNPRHWRRKHWFYEADITHTIQNVHAPCSRIKIHDLTKINVPNKFFFAVPEGLNIKVPEYAGLIKISSQGPVMVKQAPFLHKRKLEIWKTLLDKFYYKYYRTN